MKKKIGLVLAISVVLFAVFISADLVVIRLIDKGEAERQLLTNVEEERLKRLDAGPDGGGLPYSFIMDKTMTHDEFQEQKILQTQQSMLMFNNLDMSQDIYLPDKTWFLDTEKAFLKISYKKEDGDNDIWVATFENPQLLEKYRSYRADAFYEYRKNFEEMQETYRYYKLVVERFYLDGMTAYPEQVSIYRVELLTDPASGNTSDTCKLMETVQLDVPEDKKNDCFILQTQIDSFTVEELVYDYSRNGAPGYLVGSDCVLSEKYITLEERDFRLKESLSGFRISQRKDLIGFSKYYYKKQKSECDLLGGEVSMVRCQNGFYYHVYQYTWMYLVMVVAIEGVISIVVAAGVSAIVLLVKNKSSAKQKKKSGTY